MKYFILLLCLSCSSESIFNPSKETEEERALIQVNRLIYIQDKSTHLCFAISDPNTTFSTMINVPCSVEVINKVTNK